MPDDPAARATPATPTMSWVAVSDVAIGLVILLVGLARDSTPLAVAGGVLLLLGAGVLATASVLRNRTPER